MILAHIVAIDEKGGIGKDNGLLGHFPEDLKRFKAATEGHIVVMGYNTWLSLPFKPLPKRVNIVLAPREKIKELQDEYGKTSGTMFVSELDDALMLAEIIIENHSLPERIFIMGGAMLYKTTYEMADELWITEIQEDFEADAFYPKTMKDMMMWEGLEVEDVDIFFEDNGVKMLFIKFTK